MAFKIRYNLFVLLQVYYILSISSQDSILHRHIIATSFNGEIKLDGYLNEGYWAQADNVDQFITAEPEEGLAAKFRTNVRILYDDKSLYFGVLCYDSELKKGLRVTEIRRDFDDDENENFAIALDLELKEEIGTVFCVSPYGNLKDMETYNSGLNKNENWNTNFTASTQILDSCWSAEIQIPFKSLRYTSKSNSMTRDIGVRFFRIARRENEVSSFPAYKRQLPKYRMTHTAYLGGISFPKSSSNLQIRPYVLGQWNKGPNQNDIKPKIGMDGKWLYKPNIVLDFSANTDFAQAEADQQIINLSRIANTLPEKRQFFLESATQFTQGDPFLYLPFNSRTIGLDGSGIPIPIHFGLRYIQQNSKSSIGVLILQQQEVNDDGKKRNNQIGVISIKNNLSKHLTFSSLATFKTILHNKSYNTESNSCVSIEMNYQNNELIGGFTGTLSYDHRSANSIGIGSILWAQKDSKKYWFLSSFTLMSQKFNPALGFVSFPNSLECFIGMDKRYWPDNIFGNKIRIIDPGFEFDYYFNASNLKPYFIQHRFVPLRFKLKNNTKFSSYQYFTRDFLYEDFHILDATLKPGIYNFWFALTEFKTDLSKKFAFKIEQQFGEYYNGHFLRFKPYFKYAPNPYFSIFAEWYFTHLIKVGSERKNQDLHLITPGIKFSINSKFHFSGFFQYHSYEKTNHTNLRIEWEYKPLSYVYFVFNTIKDDLNRTEQNQAIAKLNFLYQF